MPSQISKHGYPCLVGIVLSLCLAVANAQPGDPNQGNKPGSVPLSGIEILATAGALWGAKQVWDKRRRRR